MLKTLTTYIDLKKRKLIFIIKKLLPDTLLVRTLSIIAIVLFLVQLTFVIIAYDNLWRQIRSTFIKNNAIIIAYFVHLYESDNKEIPHLEKFFDLRPNIINNDALPLNNHHLDKNERLLYSYLSDFLKNDLYITLYENNKSIIQITVRLKDNRLLAFYVEKSILYNLSTQTIVIFMLIFYIIVLALIIQLFRNQVKPLKGLSKAAVRFGKGENPPYLKPTGSIEIREATIAFNEMKDRIQNFIEQRTLMLSGISHDLKTSLTKMNLILDIAENDNNKKLIHELKTEMASMDQMISSYLFFSQKSSYQINKHPLVIKSFFNHMISFYNSKLDITIHYLQSKKNLNADYISMKRVFDNLLSNCLKYATKLNITIEDYGYHAVIINFEDNGPGIPQEKYADVFKPFYKLNEARTPEKGSVGLGLSVIKDIISQHGGNIILNKSDKLHGLKVSIILPY